MNFTKPNFDIGLFTNKKDEQLHFWGNVIGLQFDETLKLGGGVLQHRFAAHGSIVKVNDSRSALTRSVPQPISKLAIVSNRITSPCEHTDPDGNVIAIVPTDHHGITSVGVVLPVKDVLHSSRFFEDALGLSNVRDGLIRCGESLIFLEQSDAARPNDRLVANGLRYLTLQVRRCDEAHKAALAAGAREGRQPATLGATARVSFVISPDGLWIELSERASLTGAPV